jgi:hypothetical protein
MATHQKAEKTAKMRTGKRIFTTAMNYLDHDKLGKFPGREFRRRKPYPWANPKGILRQEAFQHLVDRLPDINLFEKRFGYTRSHGQKGHDRYSLEYDRELPIDPSWHEFVEELRKGPYRRFLRKLYGLRPFKLSFHWHYTERGGAVSPHCDSRVKIGSHIFYLNTETDWKAEWGGQTLVLDDHGRMSCKSAPEFSDFEEPPVVADAIGNRSMVFKRTPHSWHGVRAIDCPEGHLRKVFIVVIERVRPLKAVRKFFQNTGSEGA